MESKYHGDICIKISPRRNSTPLFLPRPEGSKWLNVLYLVEESWSRANGIRVSWKTALALWSQLGLDQLKQQWRHTGKLLLLWKNPFKTKPVMTIKNPKGPQAMKLHIDVVLFSNIPHWQVNFCPNGQHSFWMSLVEGSQAEDKGMILQIPKVYLSRGHFQDERWANQSKYSQTRPQVQELTWAWLSALEQLLGFGPGGCRGWNCYGWGCRHGHAPINSLLGGATLRYSAFSAAGPLKRPFDLASFRRQSCW